MWPAPTTAGWPALDSSFEGVFDAVGVVEGPRDVGLCVVVSRLPVALPEGVPVAAAAAFVRGAVPVGEVGERVCLGVALVFDVAVLDECFGGPEARRCAAELFVVLRSCAGRLPRPWTVFRPGWWGVGESSPRRRRRVPYVR